MKKLAFHPACLLFPKLGKAELQQLADDIKANGLRNSIILFQGKVLDGRNRLAACKIAKVKPRFVEWDGKGSPTEWVISENLIRRHLTSSQRAVIAHDLLPLLEQEAKERQRLGKGRGKRGVKSCTTLLGKASAAAARIAKTNATYVAAVKSIAKSAPELIEKMRNGDLSILDAKEVAKLPSKDRSSIVKQIGNGQAGTKAKDYWAERRYGLKRNDDNPLDFHPTPEYVTEALIACEQFEGSILEPASGDGAIMRVLKKAGYSVTGTDIVKGTDFLKTRKSVANIITNPPYAEGMAEQFCRHALAIAKRKVAMLLPMWFLEGVQRHDLFREQPLKAVYIFSRRPTFGEQDHHAPFGSCWIVWDKGYKGKPRIEWILD